MSARELGGRLPRRRRISCPETENHCRADGSACTAVGLPGRTGHRVARGVQPRYRLAADVQNAAVAIRARTALGSHRAHRHRDRVDVDRAEGLSSGCGGVVVAPISVVSAGASVELGIVFVCDVPVPRVQRPRQTVASIPVFSANSTRSLDWQNHGGTGPSGSTPRNPYRLRCWSSKTIQAGSLR